MNKWFIIIGLILIVIVSATDLPMIQMRAGKQIIVPTDTIIKTDSVRVPIHFWGDYQEGFYNLFYMVDSMKDGPTKVLLKLYFEEAFDTAYGYYNRTLIDSMVAPESTLMIFDSYYKGNEYGRFIFVGFMATGDSCKCLMGLQAIPAPKR